MLYQYDFFYHKTYHLKFLKENYVLFNILHRDTLDFSLFIINFVTTFIFVIF